MEVTVYHLPDNHHPPLPPAFLARHRALPLGSVASRVHCQEGSYHQDNEDDPEHSLQVRHAC